MKILLVLEWIDFSFQVTKFLSITKLIPHLVRLSLETWPRGQEVQDVAPWSSAISFSGHKRHLLTVSSRYFPAEQITAKYYWKTGEVL